MPKKSPYITSIRKGMMWGIRVILDLPMIGFVDIGRAWWLWWVNTLGVRLRAEKAWAPAQYHDGVGLWH